MTLLIDGQPETTDMGQLVSGGYFGGLGVSAIAGRILIDTDDQPSAPPVGVISYRFWERRFNRDPSLAPVPDLESSRKHPRSQRVHSSEGNRRRR